MYIHFLRTPRFTRLELRRRNGDVVLTALPMNEGIGLALASLLMGMFKCGISFDYHG